MADLLSAALQAGYMHPGDYGQDSESSADDSKFPRRAGGRADAEEGQGYGAHRERQAIPGIYAALVWDRDYASAGRVAVLHGVDAQVHVRSCRSAWVEMAGGVGRSIYRSIYLSMYASTYRSIDVSTC